MRKKKNYFLESDCLLCMCRVNEIFFFFFTVLILISSTFFLWVVICAFVLHHLPSSSSSLSSKKLNYLSSSSTKPKCKIKNILLAFIMRNSNTQDSTVALLSLSLSIWTVFFFFRIIYTRILNLNYLSILPVAEASLFFLEFFLYYLLLSTICPVAACCCPPKKRVDI